MCDVCVVGADYSHYCGWAPLRARVQKKENEEEDGPKEEVPNVWGEERRRWYTAGEKGWPQRRTARTPAAAAPTKQGARCKRASAR